MKKIKRRKIKKYRICLYILLFILIVITMSSAYAYISNLLKIDGVISIKKPENVNICDGKLTYEIQSWSNTDNLYYYLLRFTLTNTSTKAYNTWDVYFDIPEDTQLLSYSSVDAEIVRNKLKVSSLNYNSYLQPDNSINFEVQLVTSNMYYEPTNISVNNCYITNDNPNDMPNDGPNDDVYGDLNINFDFISSYNDEKAGKIYQYDVYVTNNTEDTITNWQFSIEKPSNYEIVNAWNCNYIVKNNVIEFSNMTYNGFLEPGAIARFGIMIRTDQQEYSPVILN